LIKALLEPAAGCQKLGPTHQLTVYSQTSINNTQSNVDLLNTNNVNVESTVLNTRALDGTTNFVNTAPRPGVDKITFQRYDPGQRPLTNIYTDTYVQNGQSKTQTLQRLIVTPDIIFTAENHPRHQWWPAFIRRTRPNFSHANPTGSGTLNPQIKISFHKLADVHREPMYQNPDNPDEIYDSRWSAYDSETYRPTTIFPIGPKYEGGRTLSLRKLENPAAIEWKLRLIAGVTYSIESSPDLLTWTTLTNITAAPIHTLTNSLPAQSQHFYRARRIQQ
jgi:hypothetical protein